MQAKVYKSNKWNVCRVMQCGDILNEFKTEEIAKAYCDGYNAALTNNEEEKTP